MMTWTDAMPIKFAIGMMTTSFQWLSELLFALKKMLLWSTKQLATQVYLAAGRHGMSVSEGLQIFAEGSPSWTTGGRLILIPSREDRHRMTPTVRPEQGYEIEETFVQAEYDNWNCKILIF
jgi:hypothetical protein